MQICDSVHSSHPLQFFHRSNTNYLRAVFVCPQWDRRAPVAVARYRPITCLLQPVAESLLFHEIWHPTNMRSKSIYIAQNQRSFQSLHPYCEIHCYLRPINSFFGCLPSMSKVVSFSRSRTVTLLRLCGLCNSSDILATLKIFRLTTNHK